MCVLLSLFLLFQLNEPSASKSHKKTGLSANQRRKPALGICCCCVFWRQQIEPRSLLISSALFCHVPFFLFQFFVSFLSFFVVCWLFCDTSSNKQQTDEALKERSETYSVVCRRRPCCVRSFHSSWGSCNIKRKKKSSVLCTFLQQKTGKDHLPTAKSKPNQTIFTNVFKRKGRRRRCTQRIHKRHAHPPLPVCLPMLLAHAAAFRTPPSPCLWLAICLAFALHCLALPSAFVLPGLSSGPWRAAAQKALHLHCLIFLVLTLGA